MSEDKTNIVVHGAGMADLPEIMRLLPVIHQEGGLYPLDEDLACEAVTRALREKDKDGIIGVIRGDGTEIRAMIFLILSRMLMTWQYHLEEVYNYVRPEYRRSNYADALIRYAQHARQQLGIPLVIGVLTNIRMEAKVRLYERRLGRPSGAFFVDGAEWASDRAPDDALWRKHSRGGKRHSDLPRGNGTATISLSSA